MPITVKTTKGSLGTGTVVVRDVATGSIDLNGAPGANAVGETVTSMTISEVAWSVSGSNTWTLARGANNVLVLAGSGQMKFDDSQLKLEQNNLEEIDDISWTLSAGTGSIVIRVRKKSGDD